MKHSVYSILLVLVGCGGGNSFSPETAGVSDPDSGSKSTGGNSSVNSTNPTAGNSSNNTTGGFSGIFTTNVSQATGGTNTTGTGGSMIMTTGGNSPVTTGGSSSATGGNQGTGGSTCNSILTLDYIKATFGCDTSNPLAYGSQLVQPVSGAFIIQDSNTLSIYWCTDNRSEPTGCTQTISGSSPSFSIFR